MEPIHIAILIVAVIIIFTYMRPTTENMTTKDLMKTMKKFEKTSSESPDKYQEEIYGPKTSKLEPKPSSPPSKKNGDKGNNFYPYIYGPEIVGVPGKPKHEPKKTDQPKTNFHEEDDDPESVYEYNPDLKRAFPTEEGDPRPYLTDFSKLLH